jgi:hypothetical protein
MSRPARLLWIVVSAAVALVVVLAPSAARAADRTVVRHLERISHGAAVRATVALRCDPAGPETTTYFSLTLWQGYYLRNDYVEGFGGIVSPDQPPIVCDGSAHVYRFTVTPTSAYAGKRFRPGPAGAEYTFTRCTEVTPGDSVCTSDELVRDRVRISP